MWGHLACKPADSTSQIMWPLYKTLVEHSEISDRVRLNTSQLTLLWAKTRLMDPLYFYPYQQLTNTRVWYERMTKNYQVN